jgi:ubiquinone biosynthesis O-methyltransferase
MKERRMRIWDMTHERVLLRKWVAVAYGVACHGLFVAGVAMMIFQMYSGMSHTFGRLDPPWRYLANALLVLQFPLTHSALLGLRGRKLMEMLAPRDFAADLAPTLFVIIASLQTLMLFSLWTPSGLVWWEAEGPARVVLSLLYAASWLMLAKAIADAGAGLQTGAIGWTALYRGRRPAYPPMPRHGLFRFVRQPIYLAFALTLWTVPIWTPDQLALALVLTTYCLVGPLFKEARFHRLFGEDFARYRAQHRYFLPWPVTAATRNDLTIYDRFAPRWWDGSVRWLRTLQNLVPARLAHFDTVTDWRGKAVLDLGCGGGFMAEALARRGAAVTGIDPAAQAIAIATRHAADTGLAIRYLAGSGEALPFVDGSMDIVVSVDVLEHVSDLGLVLAEVARVLKPGGLFLFDTINRTFLARLVIVFLGETVLRLLPPGTHDPAKFIRPAELGAALEKLGFTVAPFHGIGPRGLSRNFDVTFGAVPTLAIVYAGVARKSATEAVSSPRAG